MRSFIVCLALLALGAAAEAATDWSAARAALCPSAAAPVIDGKLDDPAWQAVPSLAGFVTHPEGGPADPPTTLRIAHDEGSVFIGLSCVEPDMAAAKSAATETDADVFDENCAVVVFDVGRERRQHGFIEFAANLLGTKHDAFDDDHSWNGTWRVAVQRGADGWTMEMAIPFTDLRRRPESGDLWGFNAARYRNIGDVEQVFVWSRPRDGFWNTENFGCVVFDSLERNLARDLDRLEQRVAADQPYLAGVARKFGPDDQYVREALAAPTIAAELRGRVETGVKDGDAWRELKVASARAEAEYEDAMWNLRFEELFAD